MKKKSFRTYQIAHKLRNRQLQDGTVRINSCNSSLTHVPETLPSSCISVRSNIFTIEELEPIRFCDISSLKPYSFVGNKEIHGYNPTKTRRIKRSQSITRRNTDINELKLPPILSNRTPIDKPLLECNLNGDQVKVSPTMRNEKHIMKFVDRFSHLEMMVVEECGVNIVEARECLKELKLGIKGRMKKGEVKGNDCGEAVEGGVEGECGIKKKKNELGVKLGIGGKKMKRRTQRERADLKRNKENLLEISKPIIPTCPRNTQR